MLTYSSPICSSIGPHTLLSSTSGQFSILSWIDIPPNLPASALVRFSIHVALPSLVHHHFDATNLSTLITLASFKKSPILWNCFLDDSDWSQRPSRSLIGHRDDPEDETTNEIRGSLNRPPIVGIYKSDLKSCSPVIIVAPELRLTATRGTLN